MSQADEQAYYAAHKADFEQPEQVRLSEILVPLAETASPAEIATAEAKANDLKSKVMAGGDFADIAKKFSGGPSAAQGGELGQFKRGALAKVLEDATFSLPPGGSTQPIRTRQGFVILKVSSHDQAGPAPIEQVEQQIQEQLYTQAMQPALRAYLTKLRQDSYVDIQPGFVDSGAAPGETKPIFTAYAPPPVKKKVVKQTVRFDRRTGTAAPAPAVISSPDTTGGRTLTGAEAKETSLRGCGPQHRARCDCGGAGQHQAREGGKQQGAQACQQGKDPVWPGSAQRAARGRGRDGDEDGRRRRGSARRCDQPGPRDHADGPEQ